MDVLDRARICGERIITQDHHISEPTRLDGSLTVLLASGCARIQRKGTHGFEGGLLVLLIGMIEERMDRQECLTGAKQLSELLASGTRTSTGARHACCRAAL